MVCVYGVPTTPLDSEDVVMVSTGGMMVRLRFAVAFCAGEPVSVTLKVNGVALTASVGVPEMVPDALSVRPVGSVPEVNCQLYVPLPPVAARVVV